MQTRRTSPSTIPMPPSLHPSVLELLPPTASPTRRVQGVNKRSVPCAWFTLALRSKRRHETCSIADRESWNCSQQVVPADTGKKRELHAGNKSCAGLNSHENVHTKRVTSEGYRESVVKLRVCSVCVWCDINIATILDCDGWRSFQETLLNGLPSWCIRVAFMKCRLSTLLPISTATMTCFAPGTHPTPCSVPALQAYRFLLNLKTRAWRHIYVEKWWFPAAASIYWEFSGPGYNHVDVLCISFAHSKQCRCRGLC